MPRPSRTPALRLGVSSCAALALVLGAWRLGDSAPAPTPALSTVDTTVLKTFRWRSIGPDRGGRSIAVTGVKGRPKEAYFGAVGGGLWKTVDAGNNWAPVTDGQLTSSSVGAVAGRNLRVLAVFADRRHSAYPDAPTFAELGLPSMPPGLNGLVAPKGTPPEVLATLERACEQATQSEAFRTAAQRLSQPIVFLKGAAFADVARTDFRYKGELIKALNITAE